MGLAILVFTYFIIRQKIEKMASVLVDAKSNFEKVNIVLNINSGFISGKEAVSFDLCSVDNLPDIFNLDDLPFKEILSFLDEKTTIKDLLTDFENNKDYIWWTSKEGSILRIITMYSMTGNKARAIELAKSYYQKDKCGALYRNVLRYFEKSNK